MCYFLIRHHGQYLRASTRIEPYHPDHWGALEGAHPIVERETADAVTRTLARLGFRDVTIEEHHLDGTPCAEDARGAA